MRAIVIAGALAAAAATSAHAAEPAACYDTAVIGWVSDYANDRIIDNLPVPEDRILPRARADMLVNSYSQIAGPDLPKAFWARAILTQALPPSPMLLFYLKSQPDGVPFLVGYRLAPQPYGVPPLSDYATC